MQINRFRVITLARLNLLSRRLGQRIFLLLFLLSALLSLALLSSASHNSSGEFFVFGPVNYVRERGAPSPVSSNFSAQPGPNYLLRVYNGGRDNQYRTTSRAAIWLNGVKIIRPRDFNSRCDDRHDNDDRDDERDDNDTGHNVRLIEKQVTLAAGNTLKVKLRGAPGSGITVEIIGIDRDPPTITASKMPAPNSAGWNNTSVTVSFTCADVKSGIASCPNPVTVMSDGANQVVSGTAIDRAGNRATVTTTINLDRSAPAMNVSSPVNGATFNIPDITVNGTVTDNLSGVNGVTCNGVAATLLSGSFSCSLHLQPGVNPIETRAMDKAGNTATSSLNVTLGSALVVPNVTGQTHAAATTAITQANLTVGAITTANSNTIAAGRVITQTPAAGESAATGAPVALILSLGAAGATPPISFTVDPTVVPDRSEITRLSDGAPRRVASVVDARGNQTDFVENELFLMTNDDAAVNALVARWQGQILFTINPSATRLAGLRRMHLIRINPSLADVAALVADLRSFSTVGRGEHRVSNETGLRLLAAAQMENAGGVLTTPNWIFKPQSIIDRSTAEFTPSPMPMPPLPASPFMGAGPTKAFDYTNNAFNWPYMNRLNEGGGLADIGVANAWRALLQTNRINNRIRVMIPDSGFDTSDPDLPANPITLGQIDRAGPGKCDGSDCPWHGAALTEAGFGLPDNGMGVAGPGGPVSEMVLLGTPDFDVADIVEFVVDALGSLTRGPDIISMSFAFPVPASLAPPADIFFTDVAQAFRLGGTLMIACAGNKNQDVDAEDCVPNPFGEGCVGPSWEEAAWLPCEAGGVMCVGGLDFDSRNRAVRSATRGSNFGSHPDDCCTVDIYGPYDVWLARNAGDPATVSSGLAHDVNLRQGTSYSAPFVAGIAALVWAANPSLSDGEVEDILLRTANTSPNSDVPRWVNAYAAVLEALPNDPPVINVEAIPNQLCPTPTPSPSASPTPTPVPTVTLRPPPHVCFSRGTDITFHAITNDTEDGTHLPITWQSDLDGALGSSSLLIKNDLSVGTHTITARVTDTQGVSETDSLIVTIENDLAPVMTINSPADRAFFQQGQTIPLVGTSFDGNNPPNFTLNDSDVSWLIDGSSTPSAFGHNTSLTGLSPGVHLISFVGFDGFYTSSDFISITVEPTNPIPGQTPQVNITTPLNGQVFEVNEVSPDVFGISVALAGTASDAEDGSVPPNRLVWTTRRNNEPEETLGLGSNLSTILTTAGLSAITSRTLTLYATDSSGAVGSQTVTIQLQFPDLDGDGLTLQQETALGTNPASVDTDQDGVWDGAEVFLATDPNSSASFPSSITPGLLFASTSHVRSGAYLTVLNPHSAAFGIFSQPDNGLGFGLATDRNGSLYISRSNILSLQDPIRNVMTDVGNFVIPGVSSIRVSEITAHPSDGMLYGIQEGPAPNFLPTGQLLRINPANAEVTLIGAGNNPRINSLEFDSAGNLYASVEDAPDSDLLVQMDSSTGEITRSVGSIGFGPIYGLALDASGALIASHRISNRQSRMLLIDPATGAVTTLSMIDRAVFELATVRCQLPCLDQPPTVSLPVAGSKIQVGDFNQDSYLDIVTQAGRIFLNDGTGQFSEGQSLNPVVAGSTGVAVGDMNRDGHLDIAISAPLALHLFLGDGAGGFTAAAGSPLTLPDPTFPLTDIEIADFNVDGFLDVMAATGSVEGGRIKMFRGDGTGHLVETNLFGESTRFSDIEVGFIDQDSFPDIVITGTRLVGGIGRALVFFGAGTGVQPGPILQNSSGIPKVAIGDLNGDGFADVAFALRNAMQIIVMPGAGGRSFGTNITLDVPHQLSSVNIGDLTGDGKPELVAGGFDCTVLINQGALTFQQSPSSPFNVNQGSIFPYILADMNNDGLLDVIAPGQGIWILYNHPPH